MLVILIHNDGTGTDEIGNYTYTVGINRRILERGSIKGHIRAHGWRELIQSIAKNDPELDCADIHDLEEQAKHDQAFEADREAIIHLGRYGN